MTCPTVSEPVYRPSVTESTRSLAWVVVGTMTRRRSLTIDSEDVQGGEEVEFEHVEPWMKKHVFQSLWDTALDVATGSCASGPIVPADFGPYLQRIDDEYQFYGMLKQEQSILILFQLERLHDTDQIRITVKNTDPVEKRELLRVVRSIQEKIQPITDPPMTPRPFTPGSSSSASFHQSLVPAESVVPSEEICT